MAAARHRSGARSRAPPASLFPSEPFIRSFTFGLRAPAHGTAVGLDHVERVAAEAHILGARGAGGHESAVRRAAARADPLSGDFERGGAWLRDWPDCFDITHTATA